MHPLSLQSRLVLLGYDLGPAGVDGMVGPRTRAAVTTFRERWGITETGDAWLSTARSLDVQLAIVDSRIPRALQLVEEDVRYVWGAGQPSDFSRDDILSLAAGVPTAESNGACGLDCSGQVQGLAVVDGLLRATEPDRSAHGLAMQALDPVALADASYGDVVLIDRDHDRRIEHTGTYLCDGWMLHMGGGRRELYGTDPRACAKVARVPSGAILGRWKASVRS